MPEQRFFAIGQFGGQDPVLAGDLDRGHRIRVGDRIERVASEVRFAVWDHFRLSADKSGAATLQSLLDAPVDEAGTPPDPEVRDVLAAAAAHLLERGLLVENPLDTRELASVATSYGGYPLLSGLDEYADEPRVYRVGVPGAYTVELTAEQFDLWTLLPRVSTIAELAALVKERADASNASSSSNVGFGEQLLRRTLYRVTELAALRVACLDRA